jgi:uncharacterized repeat protein (TIGR03809 family)
VILRRPILRVDAFFGIAAAAMALVALVLRVHRARFSPVRAKSSSTLVASLMTDTTLNLRDYHVSRWRKLAEQRLEHVTDLFVSGRWQRYFSERDFLEIVRQSKDAVAMWRRLDAPPPEVQFVFVDRPSIVADEPAALEPEPEPSAVGYLAPHVRLETMLKDTELASLAAVAELRPAMRLPSPFEDAVSSIAVQRVGRA